MSSFKRVDDNDPDAVQYSSGWFQAGGSSEYRGTTHGTRTAGSIAIFTFHGTYVEVYGTQSSEYGADPIVQFRLDEEDTIQTYAPDLDEYTRYQQLMYSSPQLEPKEHRIVINSTVDNSWVWLDFFIYDSVPTSVPSSESIPSSTSSSSSSRSSSSSISTTLPGLSSSATSSTAPTAQPLPIPTIVGSAIAGSLAMLLIGGIIGIWCYRRRTREPFNKEGQLTSPKHSALTACEPYFLPPLTPPETRKNRGVYPSGQTVVSPPTPPAYR